MRTHKPTKFQKEHPEIRSPKVSHIRTVKPEFFVHEEVSEMSVAARYAEIGLWTVCDWHGRFEWKPRSLKLRIMPFDNVDFDSLMAEWVKHGFVEQYEVNGQKYGRVLRWSTHQAVNIREKESNCIYPAPPENISAPAQNSAESVPADAKQVLARAGGAGIGSGFGNGNENGHLSFISANERTKDCSAPLDSRDTDKDEKVQELKSLFHSETDFPLKPTKEQKSVLADLIDKHGMEVMREAIRQCANESNHNWDIINSPCSLLLDGINPYIKIAKDRLEYEKKYGAIGVAQ